MLFTHAEQHAIFAAMIQSDSHSHPLAMVSFRITGSLVDPRIWTTDFNVQPSYAARKGDRRLGKYPHPTGIWLLDSTVSSDDLEPHLTDLIIKLGLPRPDFADRLLLDHAKADMFCFWENYTGNRVPIIETAAIHLLETHLIMVEIDEYPQEVTLCSERECHKALL